MASLEDFQSSKFIALFLSANDQALITLTGLDHKAFSYIWERMATLCQTPLWTQKTVLSSALRALLSDEKH